MPETLLWDPWENAVIGNVVSDNRVADLGVAGVGVDTSTLGNCFAGNIFTTSAPTDIETLAPCGGDRLAATGTARRSTSLSWLADAETNPPSVDYQTATLPDPPDARGMADPATRARRAGSRPPRTVDLDAIAVPAKPAG